MLATLSSLVSAIALAGCFACLSNESSYMNILIVSIGAGLNAVILGSVFEHNRSFYAKMIGKCGCHEEDDKPSLVGSSSNTVTRGANSVSEIRYVHDRSNIVSESAPPTLDNFVIVKSESDPESFAPTPELSVPMTFDEKETSDDLSAFDDDDDDADEHIGPKLQLRNVMSDPVPRTQDAQNHDNKMTVPKKPPPLKPSPVSLPDVREMTSLKKSQRWKAETSVHNESKEEGREEKPKETARRKLTGTEGEILAALHSHREMGRMSGISENGGRSRAASSPEQNKLKMERAAVALIGFLTFNDFLEDDGTRESLKSDLDSIFHKFHASAAKN